MQGLHKAGRYTDTTILGWQSVRGSFSSLLRRWGCGIWTPVCNKSWSKSSGRVESSPMHGESSRIGKSGCQAAWACSTTTAQTQLTHTSTTWSVQTWSTQIWSAQTRTCWRTPRPKLDQKSKECKQKLCGQVLSLHAREMGPGIKVLRIVANYIVLWALDGSFLGQHGIRISPVTSRQSKGKSCGHNCPTTLGKNLFIWQH